MPMYFLNIYKEKGMTSFDVIHKLRKILNIKKIGHSGTLDPLAQGVLQIGVGGASRLLEYLDEDKSYKAQIKFGYTTDTLDDEGEKKFISAPDFNEEQLICALEKFKGKISQIPPEYSAVKIGGKKLCDLARANKTLPEIKPRNVEIFEIKLIKFTAPDEAEIFIHCSKGTYIRSIVRDIGEILGCGAYMSGLVRTKAGNFKIEDSKKISPDIEKYAINPIFALNFKKIQLNENEYKKVINGNPLKCGISGKNGEKFMLIYNNALVSIANLSDNILKMEKVFKTE